MKNCAVTRFEEMYDMYYEQVAEELRRGRKESHWMWFIFPQLKALGRSRKALYYGLEDINEAMQYLAHPVLGARLKEISEVLLTLETNDPYKVMGDIDALKLCSSMTLFAEIEGYDSVFGKVIDKYYGGSKDANTIDLLNA